MNCPAVNLHSLSSKNGIISCQLCLASACSRLKATTQAPQKVKILVYLAAYLPQDGDSLVSMAKQDHDAKIGPHLQIQKEKGIASIEYSARTDLFANGGPDELRKAIPNLILDEPLAPLATPGQGHQYERRQSRQGLYPHDPGPGHQPRVSGADGRQHPGACRIHSADRPHPVPHQP